MNFNNFYMKEEIIDNPKFMSWFSNSKIVDSKGNPLVVYHGSKSKFDKFDYKFLATNGRSEGAGFYFTDDIKQAEIYGNIIYPCYLKITKPITVKTKKFSKTIVRKILIEIAKFEMEKYGETIDMTFLSNIGDIEYEGYNKVLNDATEMYGSEETFLNFQGSLIGSGVTADCVNKGIFKVTGYDGIIANGYGNLGTIGSTGTNMTIYIPFFANQIKEISNKHLSDSDSIHE